MRRLPGHFFQRISPVVLKYLWQTWRLRVTEGGGCGPTRPERTLTRLTTLLWVCAEGVTSEEKVHRHYQESNGQMLAERLLHSAHRLPEPPTADERIRVEWNSKVRPVMSGQRRFVSPFYRPQCLAAAAPAGKAKLTHPGKAILAGREVWLLALK